MCIDDKGEMGVWNIKHILPCWNGWHNFKFNAKIPSVIAISMYIMTIALEYITNFSKLTIVSNNNLHRLNVC